MNKKILLSVLTIGLVAIVAFGVTRALFFDTETSIGNTLTAGTLDLEVDGPDTMVPFDVGPLAPGDSASVTGLANWEVENVGNIPGTLTVCISNIVDHESVGDTEYEQDGDPGELGDYLTIDASVKGPTTQRWFMGSDRTLAYQGSGSCWDLMSLMDQVGCGNAGVLEEGDTCNVRFGYKMDLTGTKNPPSPVDWNEIQGDWVTFDLTLTLDQYVPGP